MTFARLRHAPWEPAIFPFADDAGGLLTGTAPLRELQRAEAGGLVDVPASSPLPEGTTSACALDVVFSRETLAALVAAANGRVVQAAIRARTPLWNAATRMTPRDDDLRLPLWAGPLAGRTAALDGDVVDAFPDATVVAVCDEDAAEVVRVPPHGRAPHTLSLPKVAKLGGRLRHWVDVLELSLAAKETARLRLGGKNELRGKVDVHPTATVIGSILDDGVRLEQHASVIDSYVGKGALIADHSVIHSCVIGDRCRTLVDTSLRRCVAMEDSTLSNLGMSDVIFGKNVFLTMSVATFGPDPGHDVVVDGIDTHRAVLGGAVGSRCILGSRALWRAGVALPPGILIVARPGEAVAKVDDAGLARAASMRGDRSRDA